MKLKLFTTKKEPRSEIHGTVLLAGISLALILIPLIFTSVVIKRYVLESIASTAEIIILSKEILPATIDPQAAQRVLRFFETPKNEPPTITLKANPFQRDGELSNSPRVDEL